MFTEAISHVYFLNSRGFKRNTSQGKWESQKSKNFSSIKLNFPSGKVMISKEHKSLHRRNITVGVSMHRILLK